MEAGTYKQLIHSVRTDDMEKLLVRFAKWQRLIETLKTYRGKVLAAYL